jgi:biofilm PGA synthesis N-glycosyltransferase PgaC
MLIFFYITLMVLIAYGILIGYYRRSWNKMPYFDMTTPGIHNDQAFVTVIIPARNEEKNIGKCLQSLLQQGYPKELMEIIVVNDHSTDHTESIVKSFEQRFIRLINLAEHMNDIPINSYKKKALEIGVSASSGEWIMTTDADCELPPNWISCMMAMRQQQQAALIAAPVRIADRGSLLSVFQSLDFISLQGITGAVVYRKMHSMCNGANLGYEKKVFLEVGGFKGIDQIASGDDMLLMHKISKKYPDRIFFLKSREAIVGTEPMSDWKAFINQRIRWASKSSHYEDESITQSLFLVYFLNLFLLILLIATIWDRKNLLFFFILVVVKTIFEFRFVHTIARFFNQQQLMKYFFFLQPLHIFYTVVAGSFGKWGSYEWKGRKIK